MKTRQKIVFWPGYYRSSLCYISWDDQNKAILSSLLVEDESVYAITEKGIVIGQVATRLSAHFREIERLSVFQTLESNAENQFDTIDKTGVLLVAMLTKLEKEVSEQFGIKIPMNTEFQILDFYGYFRHQNLRLVNTLRKHLSHRIAYTDAAHLLDHALDKNKLGDADLFVMADEGQGNQNASIDSKFVHYLNIGSIVDSVTDELERSGMTANASQLLASELQSKLKTISEGDWVEVATSEIADHGIDYWVVDRLHLDVQMEKSCRAMLEKVDSNSKSTIVLGGSFTDYAAQFLCAIGDVTVKKYDREALIKLLVSRELLILKQTCSNSTINVKIDGEHVKTLDIRDEGCSQEILHTLKFFGRDSESIEIELHDESGCFLKWNVIINTTISLDVCELPIEIVADSNCNFDCKIAARNDVYVSSIESSVYDNARLRPISDPEMSAITVQ